jgi:hypothetical protein
MISLVQERSKCDTGPEGEYGGFSDLIGQEIAGPNVLCAICRDAKSLPPNDLALCNEFAV